MTPSALGELDALLQAAQLLRLSEEGRVRDQYLGLAAKVDANGEKFEAFGLGILLGLITSYGAGPSLLPLLVYLVKVNEHGTGPAALRATVSALLLENRPESRAYIELGRDTVRRALAGDNIGPGGYAELLLRELTPH
jgi:hypothetical protein